MATVVKPKAPEVNFEIAQGDTLEYAFSWLDKDSNPLPLSAYTGKMQLKLDKTSGVSEAEITHLTGIILTDVKPNISFALLNTVTVALTLNTPYFYDLELTSAGGVVTTILTGSITSVQDVTR